MKKNKINPKDLKSKILSNLLYLIIILSILSTIVFIVNKIDKNKKSLPTSISRTIFGTEIVNENLKIVIAKSTEENKLREASVILNKGEEYIVVSSNLDITINKINDIIYHLNIEKYGEFNEKDKITISKKDGTILLETSLKQ